MLFNVVEVRALCRTVFKIPTSVNHVFMVCAQRHCDAETGLRILVSLKGNVMLQHTNSEEKKFVT